MSTIVKEKAAVIHPIPTGNFQAVCYGVWDIGLQEKEAFGDQPARSVEQLILAFELSERIESQDESNGKRYQIYKWYTRSLHEKAGLRKELASWRGKDFTPDELKGFDVDSVIGANCFLNVILGPKSGKPKAGAITAMPKGITKIAPETSPEMPEWVKKKIGATPAQPADTQEAPEDGGEEEPGMPF